MVRFVCDKLPHFVDKEVDAVVFIGLALEPGRNFAAETFDGDAVGVFVIADDLIGNRLAQPSEFRKGADELRPL